MTDQPATSTTSQPTKADLAWKRRDQGYMRGDGEWFLERGAPMAGGHTNAWLILRRVSDESHVGRDSISCYDTRNGQVLWSVDADGSTSTERADFTGALYAHDLDAGSLAEAKHTTRIVEEQEASKR